MTNNIIGLGKIAMHGGSKFDSIDTFKLGAGSENCKKFS
jgi:hypothetical protein